MANVVADLRPQYVIGENVLGHRTKGLTLVVADLRDLGYRVHVGELSACAMGTAHMRRRLFIVAHTEGIGCQLRPPTTGRSRRPTGRGLKGGPDNAWPAEPGVGRVVDGFPGRVDRLRALGNAVVPAVAEHIGRVVIDHHTI